MAIYCYYSPSLYYILILFLLTGCLTLKLTPCISVYRCYNSSFRSFLFTYSSCRTVLCICLIIYLFNSFIPSFLYTFLSVPVSQTPPYILTFPHIYLFSNLATFQIFNPLLFSTLLLVSSHALFYSSFSFLSFLLCIHVKFLSPIITFIYPILTLFL